MESKLKTQGLKEWGLCDKRPLIISGPCSAESEWQVMETARQLKEQKIDVYRAGIWKPRTRPNSFEGVGSPGLEWMQNAKKEFGLKISTEVANVKHVYDALRAGMDLIWIGARTTVNPFAIQEIADALKGVNIPVLVKNPINPDVELWIGAMERLEKAGIKKLGAIHRGFSTYGENIYRNPPNWQIPIELKRRVPGLPIIVDPSHIAGNRNRLAEISQKAMDLNFDGIMLETHCNPDEAWSDAKQQITPEEFGKLYADLVLRETSIENEEFSHTLSALRTEIDKLDKDLIQLFESRMHLAEKIGTYKKENNVTILQNSRWNEIIERTVSQGKEKGLSSEFVEKVFKAIHQESINHQTTIMNS